MKNPRILVIEDNPDNRHLVTFLLEQEGYEVLQAKDGREGLEKTQAYLPDLILLDLSIPEIDGWKLARQLKDSEQTEKICIVALTGHTLPSDRKKAMDAGCDGFITKPLDIPNFASQVREYLKG